MAIYQPSNVIPSSFAGINEQTVDASKEIRISWQVNGNSPMTGFRIKIYNNATTTTTPVKDTGILQPSNLPFYGVDNKGNPQQYIYEPKDTNNISVKWSAWGLSNNNEYKMEITQYWGTPTVNAGVVSYPDSQTVTQWSGSVFLARETPTVSINFSPALNSSGVGGYAKQTFLGTITPSSTVINSVRWQLGQINNGEKVILEDTGVINTGVIQYEYTGLKTGETYSINCIVVTQDNVEVSSGWQDFPVLYQGATNTGELTVKCLADDSNLLSWQKALDIPGTFSPSSATPSINDGILNLSAGQSVSWNKVDNEAMSFSSPWNAVVKGKPTTYYTIDDIETTNYATYRTIISPNKKILVSLPYPITPNQGETWVLYENVSLPETEYLEGYFTSNNKIFIGITTDSSAGTITYNGNQDEDTVTVYNSTNGWVDEIYRTLIFKSTDLPTGDLLSWLQANGTKQSTPSYTKKVQLYSISSNGTIVYQSNLNEMGYIGAFSYDGKYFVLSNGVSGAYLYSVSTTGIFSLIEEITDYSYGNYISFSPTANTFFFGNGQIFRIIDSHARLWGKIGSNITNEDVAVFTNDGNTLYYNSNIQDSIGDYYLMKYNVDYNTVPSQWESTGVYYPTGQTSQLLCCKIQDEDILFGIIQPTSNNTSGNILYYDYYGFHLVSTFILDSNLNSFSSISPDGETLICPFYNNDGLIGVYRIETQLDELGHYAHNIILQTKIENAKTYSCVFYDNNNVIFGGYSDTSSTFLQNGLVLVKGGNYLDFRINGTKYLQNLPTWAWLKLGVDDIQTVILTSDGKIIIDGAEISYTAPSTINSVAIYGEGTFDYIYITQDSITYTPNFTPVWDSKTLFFANFTTDLQGGTLSVSGNINNVLYRVDADGNLSFLVSVPTTITKIKDYGIRSANKYSYQLFYIDETSKYSTPISSGQTCRQFRAFSLIEASQNENNPNVYEVLKVWRFGNNLSTGSISNNNSPNWLTNFTPYRLRQPSARNGQSGTLQALLSNYNQSKNFYQDTVALMDELKQASLSTNTFFLKDMKGNLYMVGISGPITQTVNIKSKVQEVTISVPWEEVGDASNVSLIQYVTDDSKVKEDEVLSVVLSVNPATGMLSATYPQNYYGTEFSLYALTPVEVDGQILFKLENGSVTATKNNK